MMAAEVRQQNRVYPSEKCLGANCAQVLVSLSAIVKPSPASILCLAMSTPSVTVLSLTPVWM
jgi:hypothetical protein